MDKKNRARFIEIGKKYTKNINCYNFGPGTEKMLSRRVANNKGVPAETWTNVFKFMKKSYEKPDISEGFSKIITPPKKYEFHAFEFDGIIVEDRFPKIGDIIDETAEKIHDLYQNLKNIIIIWTCRSGNDESAMMDFLLKNKIPFDFINENPFCNTGGRKIFADKYYDYRNEMLT